MFSTVSIKNFQSHKDTEIQFGNGVNVLVGSSDQGKSAVLRAILWAVNNRPLGTDDIVSHWARDAKNKIADTMSVKVETENGIVIRRRTADQNEYILKDSQDDKRRKLFEAVNKDVPEDVQKFFRLSEVNIQQQHDAPFLLSASASDVAKYFNKIVRLDVIDVVLGNAESARRDTNKKIKETENEKKEFEKQLECYAWIETAQELTDKLLSIAERIKVYTDDWNFLGGEIEKHEVIKKELADVPDCKKAFEIIEKIESIKIDYEGLNELEKSIEKYREMNRDRKIFEMIKNGNNILCEIDMCAGGIAKDDLNKIAVQKEIDEYTESKKLSDIGFDKEKALSLVTEIDAIRPQYDELRMLNSQLADFETCVKQMEQAAIETSKLKKQLPDECPLCGAPMKGDIC
jgi:DNA repair ATPase RecN